jgi:chemotaxis signal transduction protein
LGLEKNVLEDRARRYAQVAEAPRRVLTTAVTFTRSGHRCALSLTCLREVRPLHLVCPIPFARPPFHGILHYRGELLSLVDVAALLGTSTPQPAAAWVLVIEHEDERVGLLADEVLDVADVEAKDVSPVPLTLGESGEVFVGLMRDGSLLIDVPKLICSPQLASAF